MTLPTLESLLIKHGLTWEEFDKRGRPAKGIAEKRSNLITDLHSQGISWDDMQKITGKSVMFIARNTKAMWNLKSRERVREAARKTALARRGESKPWLRKQMLSAWEEGKFDFHKGRVRSEEERQRLKESHTPEVRQKMSERSLRRWKCPSYRKNLLEFHRSPEERERRSLAQIQRMLENPKMYAKGKGAVVSAQKSKRKTSFWVRSSYEQAAVRLLETNHDVKVFEYERRCYLDSRYFLPDFIVEYRDGSKTLVEVKASWVLDMPSEHKESVRLDLARRFAKKHGMAFEIWTEKDRLKDALTRK